MARLLKNSAKGHWDIQTYRGGSGCDCDDMSACCQKEWEDVEAFGDRVMKFPAGDGQAMYHVVKENPLTLEWIPYGDAWQIPTAHLRGLNYEDWVLQQEWNKKIAQLFGRKEQ
tara:strand:+ start:343 stop:681 length:339 start_codon:yes stop_codon:yes gene_type:complete